MNTNKYEGMKKMLLTGVVSAIASQACKPIIEQGLGILKSNLFYTVSISDAMYDITVALDEIMTNYPESVEFHAGESHFISERVKFKALGWGFADDYVDFLMYEGTPILIKINKFMKQEGGHRSPNGAYLITFNNKYNKQTLRKFVKKLYDISREKYVEEFTTREYNVKTVNINNNVSESNWVNHKLRTFDDVFMPAAQKKFLIESIDAYVNNRDFYIKNNIPNHFGILLYSKPGHGKSSIAQAIAEHIGAELTVVNGDAISEIQDVIDHAMGTNSMDDKIYRVLLFEDIDSGLFNLTREKQYTKEGDDKKKNVGMATILNALDGIGAPTNVIYVFTTNHVEALDPAFIRPGRCDIHLEIKGVTKETLCDFLRYHYPETFTPYQLDEDYEVKDNLTFAELQTHVMKGESEKFIIGIARKESE